MKCKNCGHEFEGNFCSHCGQNADVRRFSFFYFVKETFFSSLDIEKGFFYTLKALLFNPGEAIRGYLEGKRVSLYVPGKYLLLVGAVATFLAIYFGLYLSEDVGSLYASKTFLPELQEFLMYAEEYTTVINVITIPIFALWSFLFYFRRQFNFTEHLILNIYITAEQLALLIAFTPIILIWPAIKEETIFVYSVLTILYNYWVFCDFFHASRLKSFLKIAALLVLAYVTQFLFNYCFYVFLIPHFDQWF